MTDMVCFAARMVWNGCWILFSVIMAGFGLLCLYGLGVLAVLLAQGYPLTGVTLGCLGLVMCAFSAAVMGFTFLKRRGKGVSENRHFKDSGRRWKKMMKAEEADSTGAAEGTGESGESGDEHPESGEEHGEDTGRTETEGSRENPIKRYHRRGGETTWVNYGV